MYGTGTVFLLPVPGRVSNSCVCVFVFVRVCACVYVWHVILCHTLRLGILSAFVWNWFTPHMPTQEQAYIVQYR